MTREEAKLMINYLKEMQEEYIEGKGYERHPLPEWYALDIAIKVIAIKVLEEEPILDKIRAEIAEKEARLGFSKTSDVALKVAYNEVLDIIDKYKAGMESEE